MPEPQRRSGGCHCGRVRFETTASLAEVMECNCSICAKKGFIWTFATPEQFTLVSGDDSQTDYQFNKKVIRHMFCSNCGVQSFGRGSGPDGKEMIAINARCLDDVDISALAPNPFDGKSL